MLLFVSGKKQFYRIYGVRVLTIIVSAKRAARVDRAQCSFLRDGSVSKHESELFYLHICNRQIVCGSYIGVGYNLICNNFLIF